ncbi:hypothetical protein B0H14DRAFT_2615833 [Mycena olivaceomarginata]|nr:hypothetical protein B0H14DRAFT_2615833 [Mycena olivaceomarginata]
MPPCIQRKPLDLHDVSDGVRLISRPFPRCIRRRALDFMGGSGGLQQKLLDIRWNPLASDVRCWIPVTNDVHWLQERKARVNEELWLMESQPLDGELSAGEASGPVVGYTEVAAVRWISFPLRDTAVASLDVVKPKRIFLLFAGTGGRNSLRAWCFCFCLAEDARVTTVMESRDCVRQGKTENGRRGMMSRSSCQEWIFSRFQQSRRDKNLGIKKPSDKNAYPSSKFRTCSIFSP